MTEELEDVEVNNSPYPDSVKAGIPKLAHTPKGWERAPLKKYLYEVRRPAKLKNEEKYKLVTVKRSRGGAEEREWLTGKQIKTKTQFFVEEGDFLISKRQIVHGACAIVPKELHGAVVSNEYCILHSNGGIDIGFLNYLSHTLYFQQTCFHSSIGVHVEKMIFRQNKWLDWEFNIPPIEEQKKIVRVLSVSDCLIENIALLLVAKQQRKHALMECLLDGNLRLSESKWKQIKLGELLKVKAGNAFQSQKFSKGGVPIIRISNIKSSFLIDLMNCVYYEEDSTLENYKVNYGDILIAMSGATTGKVGRYFGNSFCYLNQRVGRFDFSEGACADFIFQILKQPKIQRMILEDAIGGAQPNISNKDIEKIRIKIPSVAEQQKIATVLAAADREIDQLTQKLEAYKLHKKGLMQQLLTGKKRVGIAKSEAA
jgi:type I restriction enzyme S subunit